MIARLYQLLTGRVWTTVRCASVEFGPPPGAVYAGQLSRYTDAELLAHGHSILAALRERDQPATCARTRRGWYWTLLACGCPIGVVADEGHQHGCHRHRHRQAQPGVVAGRTVVAP